VLLKPSSSRDSKSLFQRLSPSSKLSAAINYLSNGHTQCSYQIPSSSLLPLKTSASRQAANKGYKSPLFSSPKKGLNCSSFFFEKDSANKIIKIEALFFHMKIFKIQLLKNLSSKRHVYCLSASLCHGSHQSLPFLYNTISKKKIEKDAPSLTLIKINFSTATNFYNNNPVQYRLRRCWYPINTFIRVLPLCLRSLQISITLTGGD